MEFSSATDFTGGGVSFFPLPLGLSGWQTIQATLCPEPKSAFSEGTANSGVPKKIIFI